MSYIYDIVLNFQNNYYNFFEWKRTDKLKNIIKLPLYKVSDEDIINLKYNKVTVSLDFINKLKTDNKKNKQLICLVSNNKISIALLFNQRGKLLKRSSLIFEEEEEAVEVSRHLPITKIEYIENIKIIPKDKLRIEKEKKNKLIKYIKTTNDIMTLKYLYYEYYEKEIEDIIEIKKCLLKELTKDWNPKQNNLYKLVKILTKTK